MKRINTRQCLYLVLLGICIFTPLSLRILATPNFMKDIEKKGYRVIPSPQQKPKTYRLTPAIPTTQQKDAIGDTIQQLSIDNQPQNRVLRSLEKQKPTTTNKNTAPLKPQKGLLGTKEFHMGSIKALPKWTRVLSGIKKDKPLVDQCDQDKTTCKTQKLREWRTFVQSQKGLPLKQLLKNINAYANNFPYITDQALWGKSDYWATPLEFLANSGDCEDYVILKYTTLRQLGIPAEQLRLVVVKDTVRNIAHAVLAVYDGSEIYILDSLFDAVLSHQQVLQYIPYYSVNENGRWAHIKPAR